MKVILAHGYILNVVSRKREATQQRKGPKPKARRWRAEARHGWFNRFRKMPVHYEKIEHIFLALNHLAATLMTLRKIRLVCVRTSFMSGIVKIRIQHIFTGTFNPKIWHPPKNGTRTINL